MPVRVLVVDDSALFRKVITGALSALGDVEVVASASNGRLALQRVRELKPDLVTLDIEMPEMDGLEVLDALRSGGEAAQVLVVSALTRRGGDLTVRALEKGAFDFVTKPECSSPEASREQLVRDLGPKVRALAHRVAVRAILRRGGPAAAQPASPAAATQTPRPTAAPAPAAVAPRPRIKPDLVVVGVSTGGPAALSVLLPALPGDLGVPVLVVQHMPPVFTQSLAENLAGKCALRVKEAEDGEEAVANTVYIAPGGRQMKLVPGETVRPRIRVNDDPPENNCRPAVDYLFRSVAQGFPGRAAAVILTGMGSDGTLGLRLLKRHGCFVIGQDEATCVVYGMPKAAFDAGVVDAVLPLGAIAVRLTAAVRG